MERGAPPDVLLQRPWLPVSISGVQLLAKSWFGETEYHVLLTDMQCVWGERMDSADIEKRAQELNRRLRAPVKAFFSHLSEVVRPALTGSGGGEDGEATISVTHQDDGNIGMKLKSELAGLPFYWEFHCTPAPVTVVCSQLVRPLLAMSFLLQRQVEQLGGLLGRKDAEIHDYRENGATLSRERLHTEVFEERTYREDYMSKVWNFSSLTPLTPDSSVEISSGKHLKAVPLLCSDQSDALRFDGDLQQLYGAVVSCTNSRKRKLSEEPSVEETLVDKPNNISSLGGSVVDSGAAQDVQLEAAGARRPNRPTEKQSLPSAPAERPSLKPKKKKVGLFR
ncbi:non-homologous end-joining factor 1 isoform X1 [Eleginops maclovinus]|uniref:non-homologous end-joining factor 1 isoform X1 n=1 Tax=Eleginops maclovinus TaxID=56733 RepID=UPI00307FD8BD